MARPNRKNLAPITIEEIPRLFFRNFSGAPNQYNVAGNRNFGVPLDLELAEQMGKDGWNVKFLEPREEGDERQAWLKVFLKWHDPSVGIEPPRVVLVTSRGRTKLTEEEVMLLDWANIKKVDLIIRPHVWEVNGNTGVKAWVKSIYVTIIEDDLELKYADVPEIQGAQASIGGRESLDEDGPDEDYEGGVRFR